MMTDAKSQADSLKIRTVSIAYEREGLVKDSADASKAVTAMIVDTAAVTLTPELKLGFFVQTIAGLYKPVTKEYGFFESFPAGIAYGCNVLKGYVGDMKYVFTADGAKSIGGFGAIGSLFPPVWDWYLFWKMTAFLSIILAFMNILPIPALDGGHVLFLLYEMITRRKPSETFMIRAEYVGFGLLILLMVVANLNDILRWLGYM
jgi:regulator of sigma E protease